MSRRRKQRKSRKKLAYGIIAVILILAVCFLAYSFLYSSPPQVAIVDQLSSIPGQQNPTFVNTCTSIIEGSGLTWAYYNGTEVTVNFYRKLPSYGTNLIILRVHSAIMKTPEGITSILGLFTSERYSPKAAQKYPEDVNDQRLVEAFFSEEERKNGTSYFGIVPGFIEKSMEGKFKGTIIIMMGCEGLGYDGVPYIDMAQAFIGKGAKVYIGWNGPVGVNHTDQATVHLLQLILDKLDKRTIEQAVTETMEEVGKDPTFNSTLRYYPPEVGDYTIPNLKGSLTMNVAYTSSTPRARARSKYEAHG